MLRLFKAFLFRLKRDLTFRITLFIGIGLAVFMTIIYLALESWMKMDGINIKLLTGESMLISSLSPAQNFGVAIPVNLISFTIIEFTHGTIRNKIIAGNSKGKIYASLFLSGLIFSLVLIIIYAGLCTLLGTIFGGFNPENAISATTITTGGATISSSYVVRIIIASLVSYVSITSFAVLIATLTRQIGGAIPIVIIGILFFYFAGTIVAAFKDIDSMGSLVTIVRVIDPLYALSETTTIPSSQDPNVQIQIMRDDTFYIAIANNLVYATLFFVLGLVVFRKRDVK